MTHFNQPGLIRCNFGQPLIICHGPPECPGHCFRATKFSWSSSPLEMGCLQGPTRFLWWCL